MESENVKCYELRNKNYDIKNFLYNEDEILEEELNQMISDDLIRDAIRRIIRKLIRRNE